MTAYRFPRGRIRAAVSDPRLAIMRQCDEPAETTRRRLAGDGSTPCYRCLAFSIERACHFTERTATP